MKLTYVSFEGEPEEFDQLPEPVRVALADIGHVSVDVQRDDESRPRDLDLNSHIQSRATSSTTRELVQRFAEEVLSWGGTDYRIGPSSTNEDGRTNYVRLTRPGAPVGSLAYVHPSTGKVEFRLGPEHAEGRTHARVLRRQEDNPYRVAVFITSEEALAEALDLARITIQDIESR